MFSLHPQLEKDTITLGNLPLCRLLLCNDSNYPWFILVPRRDSVREIYELSREEQQQLLDESSQVSKLIAEHFEADKINVAALGNMVPQLHVHHIVRYTTDIAWPGPVWGKVAAKPYGLEQVEEISNALIHGLEDVLRND